MKKYIRKQLYDELWKALTGKINLIQAVIGPRQVGKTTLALQIFDNWKYPKIYETADQPNIPTVSWITDKWQNARNLCKKTKQPVLLILDEVQKIPKWSEVVKKLYDEDKRLHNNNHVLLLGSSALLMQRGLTESLAGRFELHRHNQWSFSECKECFSLSLDEYIYFGGYPGALLLIEDENRWANYMRESLIEPVLSKDIILSTPITKPVLMRQSFGLAVNHAAQIVSYQKMLGTLQDAGNTTTIASYLNLMSKAFLLTPLERWSGARIRRRGSIPKILVYDNGLSTSMAGVKFNTAKKDKMFWGRLVENSIGARLYFIFNKLGGEIYYWRERNNEVDYVTRLGDKIIGFEIKSGRLDKNPAALLLFKRKYKNSKTVIISNSKELTVNSEKNININEFYKNPEKYIIEL
ncbi:MAG: ATP-binding protein [Elusimicrobiota bacterium]